MKTLIKKMFPIILIVGLVGWAFGLTYAGISVIQIKTINYGSYTWTYHEFSVVKYLQSLEHSIADSTFLNIVPTAPELPTAPNWSNVLDILKFAFNSLFIWVFNCIIYALNWIALAPLKLVLYPVNILYAIFGLNTASNEWIEAMTILYGFEIPLIPPI